MERQKLEMNMKKNYKEVTFIKGLKSFIYQAILNS